MSSVSVFGLGYVGVVCSACLYQRGHSVIGVDVNEEKVDIVSSGRSPIVEKDVEAMLEEGVNAGRIRATTDSREAVLGSEISFVCVGTPSKANGSLDLTFVEKVSREIGAALREKHIYHIVVIRSTVLPGTIEGIVVPALEETSGKKAGEGFGVAMNPEFLRESTAVYDFNNPPKTVVGALSEADADSVLDLYEGLPGFTVKTSIKVAEAVKYTDNVFHALKVTFANEIGMICKSLGIDSHAVMDIFCQDTKLNLSPYYLKPGFAFGGSCLPKDVRALTYKAGRLDIDTPVLNAITESNRKQIDRALRHVIGVGKKRIGVLGFAFKSGTDDLRESPVVELIELLIGKGYDLRLYDRSVSLAALYGANKRFIEEHIPHISSLMVETINEVLSHGEVIVIGNEAPEFAEVLNQLKPNQHVLDLVRIAPDVETKAQYEGFAW